MTPCFVLTSTLLPNLSSQLKKMLGLIFVAFGFVLTVTACSEHKPATQVAVKVNADEITVHQVNNILSKTPGITAENAATTKKEVLEKLIDQQLAVEQALNKKLDRSPEVIATFETQRRQILAQTYLQQLASAAPRPDAEDIHKYFDAHPELFKERRIFNLREVDFNATPELKSEIVGMISDNKSFQEVVEELQQRRVSLQSNSVVRSAEQLPLEVAAKLGNAKDGTVFAFDKPAGLQVMTIVASKVAPVDFETASPFIAQFLYVQKTDEVAKAEIQRLRALAKIQYEGDFVPPPANMQGAIPGASSLQPLAVTATVPPSAPAVASRGSNLIETGVNGL